MSLMEITMHNLQAAGGPANGKIDLRDFLARADVLAACGKTVLISDYFEYYRLAAYLARYTKEKIGITMGAGSLCELFDEKYYTRLDGGILESFGRLFKNDLKLYIYPLAGSADRQADHRRKPAGGARAAEPVRVPGRARLHRTVGQLQPGVFVDLLARRDRPDQSGRSLLERPCAAGSRRGDPPSRFLRPPPRRRAGTVKRKTLAVAARDNATQSAIAD